VLLQREQAEAAKGRSNVVIGEPRVIVADDKVLGKKVMLERAPNGAETLKITIPGGQVQQRGHAKFIKPKGPEVGKWKVNEAKVQQKKVKPTFDMLLSKYAKQAADSSSNRPLQLKCPRSPPCHQFQDHHGPYGPWAPAPWMRHLPMRHIMLEIIMEDGSSPQWLHILSILGEQHLEDLCLRG
jgi:hypothetical protein